MSGRATTLCAVLLLTACVDPQAAFESFTERSAQPEADAAPEPDSGACAVTTDIDGQFLLALSVNLSPTRPIVGLATVTTPALDGGAGLALTVQPLRASDRTTPVGSPVSLGPFAIGADGSYRIDAPGLLVTGLANPVTGGDIRASIVLSGRLCGDGSFFCGALDGHVDEPLPLDLAGSTFTLTRVTGTAPARPAVDCSGTLADPL